MQRELMALVAGEFRFALITLVASDTIDFTQV